MSKFTVSSLQFIGNTMITSSLDTLHTTNYKLQTIEVYS